MIQTREELERLVREKFGHSILPGYEEGVERHIQRKVNVAWNRIRIMKLGKECEYCCDEKAHPDISKKVYETPYEDEPEIRHYCSDECHCRSELDFGYCETCDREIENVARDGMTTYFRTAHGSSICLLCYEELLYKEGVSRSSIFEGRYEVIFDGMWRVHPTEAGYQTFRESYFVNGKDSVLREQLLKLYDDGNRILITLDRMGICGSEGYISIYYRKVNDAKEK